MFYRQSLTLVTPPAVEPVSLIEAQAAASVDSTDDGGLLLSLLLAARKHAEKMTGRAFVTQQWRLSQDGFPLWTEPLLLAYPPLISVETVKYLDTSGVLQTMSASDYVVDAGSDDRAEIAIAYGKFWPLTLPQRNAVTVDFTVGYGDTAEAVAEKEPGIRAAILSIVTDLYKNREAQITGAVVSVNPLAKQLLDALTPLGLA